MTNKDDAANMTNAEKRSKAWVALNAAYDAINAAHGQLVALGLEGRGAWGLIRFEAIPSIVVGSGHVGLTLEEAFPDEPEAEKRVLRLEVTRQIDEATVGVRVAEQSHRHWGFTPGGRLWVAPNGMHLHSTYSPEWNGLGAHLRGDMPYLDDDEMLVPVEEVSRLFEAVRQYNEAFGGGA